MGCVQENLSVCQRHMVAASVDSDPNAVEDIRQKAFQPRPSLKIRFALFSNDNAGDGFNLRFEPIVKIIDACFRRGISKWVESKTRFLRPRFQIVNSI